MNLEKGTTALKQELAKLRQEKDRAEVETLEKELHQLAARLDRDEPDQTAVQERFNYIVNRLKTISTRSAGVPFESLCSLEKTGVLGAAQALSLGSVVRLFFVVVFLPLFAVVMALSVVEYTGQTRLEHLQSTVQAMDEKINKAIPVSLSEKTVSPCSDAAANELRASNRLAVRLIQDTGTRDCLWEYVEPGSNDIIAKDYWGVRNLLDKREYYVGGQLVAEDIFAWWSNDCFKNRRFFDNQNRVSIEECFSEAGIAYSKKFRIIGNHFIQRSNNMRSGVPPMLRWFFYR